MTPLPPISTPFPYTTLFRSRCGRCNGRSSPTTRGWHERIRCCRRKPARWGRGCPVSRLPPAARSEEHTSEIQSPELVCRVLLEKKKQLKRRRQRLEKIGNTE